MSDLYKIKREILKKKRELRKKAMGRDEDSSAGMRVYGEATKTKRAIKIAFMGSKSKASATDGESTSIENFVRECLIENNIPFQEQGIIRYLNIDFLLKEHKIALQCEGCYFHVCPKCYPAGPKNKQQKRFLENDKKADEIINNSEYTLMKIWHHEIIENPEAVKEKIKAIKK